MHKTICESSYFKPVNKYACMKFLTLAARLKVKTNPLDSNLIAFAAYSDIGVTDEYYQTHVKENEDNMDVFIRELQQFLDEDTCVVIQVIEYDTEKTAPRSLRLYYDIIWKDYIEQSNSLLEIESKIKQITNSDYVKLIMD